MVNTKFICGSERVKPQVRKISSPLIVLVFHSSLCLKPCSCASLIAQEPYFFFYFFSAQKLYNTLDVGILCDETMA